MTDADRHVWTVRARKPEPDAAWKDWRCWVDRQTAEAEKDKALLLGYRARIVRAS